MVARISLLGPFQVTCSGKLATAFVTEAARALLAYLGVHAGSQCRREELAGLLWPDQPDATARHSLRQALSHLRHALSQRSALGERAAVEEHDRVDTQVHPYLTVTREAISLDPEAGCEVDVAAFADAIATTRAHVHRRLEACPSCIAHLRQAVELYRGEFMAGFSLPSAPFEEWLLAQREGLRLQALDALDALAAYHERRGEHEQALRYARRQLELEPWRESAHRQCMRALALRGERGAALAQYEACRRVLAQELGVEPEAETTALCEQIRGGRRTSDADLHGPSPVPLHNLPAQTTPFVGREQALDEIARWMGDSTCRLLTLVGPGGSGKTRLAMEAAAEQVYTFEHGAFFVSLAPVTSAEGIVPAIAQALGLTFYPGEEPRRQLLHYLRPRELLLVLDNCEHLIEGMSLLAELLSAAPDLRILATSRARLSLQGEQIMPVEGMDYPTSPHSLFPLSSPDGRGEGARGSGEVVLHYSAVTLFLHAARRVRPGYEPTIDDLAQITRICQLVEGMPLAILLAAAWADVLPVSEIATHVAQGLGFLEAELRDLPERQRSMRAVFDASWRLLSEQERAAFAALTIFRGGFTAEAAKAVASADLRTLSGLVRKSFLQMDPGGRYQVHELLRQYGEQKLKGSPDGGQGMRDRHAAHYVAAVERWAEELKGPGHAEASQQMAVENGNARAAWDWAVERERWEDVARAMDGLIQFYSDESRQKEGVAALRAVEDKLAGASGEGVRLVLRAAIWQLSLTDDPATWQRLFERCQSLFVDPRVAGLDMRRQRADLESHLASPSVWLVDQPKAHAAQALALYEELGDRRGMAAVHGAFGLHAWAAGDFPEARRRFEQQLELYRAAGDPYHGVWTGWWLGQVALFQGQAEECERWVRECIAVFPTRRRMVRAAELWLSGAAHTMSGRHAEAEADLDECAAIYHQFGARALLGRMLNHLGEAKMHLGRYEQAWDVAQEGVALSHENRSRMNEAWALGVLGATALAQAQGPRAAELLGQMTALSRAEESRPMLGVGLAYAAHVARHLGQADMARQSLAEALRLGLEIRSLLPLWVALPAAALLLADRGQTEQATELYALAWRYPVVSNSRWYEDVAGRELAAVAALLPPEVREAAQARGRARDLWATAQELLEEIERCPSPPR